MTSRAAALTATLAACLFGAGFALAEPGEPPAPVVTDSAPQELELDPLAVEVDLGSGRPARLAPPPRPPRRATPAPVVAPPAPVVRRPARPRPVATPRPQPVSTPAPVVTRPQPPAQPKPQPTPKPPPYVGSGFDDSG